MPEGDNFPLSSQVIAVIFAALKASHMTAVVKVRTVVGEGLLDTEAVLAGLV